jgi:predicted O-methyltransferase YrrM
VIVNSEIERYMEGLLPARDPLLAEIEAQAAQRGIPIVGPAVGRLLAQLIMLTGARRVFELGSAIGYSTIWMARAAGPDAEIHYSDGSEANAREAAGYFTRAALTGRIRAHVGDALTALAATAGEFDLIFNDVDKEGYPSVLAAAPARLRKGGLLVTDNTLWHSRVLDPRDEASRAVAEFNRALYASDMFFTTLIPLRDGVSVSLKI